MLYTMLYSYIHLYRERNREHAKRSRIRKRLLLGTLQISQTHTYTYTMHTYHYTIYTRVYANLLVHILLLYYTTIRILLYYTTCIGTLQDRLSTLRQENVKLRRLVIEKLPSIASMYIVYYTFI